MGKTMLYHIEGNDTISWVAISNSITPDGDGINDEFVIFLPSGVQYTSEFEVSIRNKNSEIIFSTKKPTQYWDGTLNGSWVENGTYFYHLILEDTTNYLFDHHGVITLIR